MWRRSYESHPEIVSAEGCCRTSDTEAFRCRSPGVQSITLHVQTPHPPAFPHVPGTLSLLNWLIFFPQGTAGSHRHSVWQAALALSMDDWRETSVNLDA